MRLMMRVKQFRLAKGLTQEKFAERAGLDYKYYQHVEAGRRPNLGMETLIKLAKGTGRELWELLKFDDEPLAAAEDSAKSGYHSIPGKSARKPIKRRSDKKVG